MTKLISKGFQEKSLRRMMQFYHVFSEFDIVATLSRQLSWSHFILLLPIKEQLQHKSHQVMASRLALAKD
ncbi:MAG: hypothetical protein ACI9LM_001170 [Alteromonadaceae bacterium]|jgi:hypothetical protein